MKDTEYFRQIDVYKNNLEPKALTNHLLHEQCMQSNCITPITKENVMGLCEKIFSLDDCKRITMTCNSVCIPLTRGCANTTLEDNSCLDLFTEINKMT